MRVGVGWGGDGDAREGVPCASLGRLGETLTLAFPFTQKRPSTMDLTPEKLSVVRPFNPAGFHFNKAKPAETLFWVAADGSVVVAPEAAPTAETDATPTERPSTTPSSAPSSGLEHRLLINVSPLVGLHSLFCPFVARELPQVLTPDSLLAALQFLRRFRRTDAKLLFNSLGAWSSVNHLHFHLVVPAPAFPEGTFPVERAERRELARAPARAPAPAEAEADAPCTLTLHDLHGWPLRSLVIERRGGGDRDGSGADDRASAMVAKLWPLVEDLLERGVPHNMLIADAGATVYLMPRRVQSIVAGGAINIAIAEACGLGIVYNEETFEVRGVAGASVQEKGARGPAHPPRWSVWEPPRGGS